MNNTFELYERTIKYSLLNTRKILISGLIVSIAGVVMFFFIDTELMPSVDPGEFTLEIEMPKGTALQQSSNIARRIETHLKKREYVRHVYSKIGSDPDDNITEKISGKGSHNIDIRVILVSSGRPHITDIIDSLRKELRFSDTVQLSFVVKQNVIESLFSNTSKPLNIEIYGNDTEELSRIGDKLIAGLNRIEGLYNINSILDSGRPEYKVTIDRSSMASIGLNIADVASTVRTAVNGEVATTFREPDNETDIRVRLNREDRTEKSSLLQILVKTGNDSTVPLGKFARIEEGSSPGKIIRSEQSRVNLITADMSGNKDDLFNKINNAINNLQVKKGYEIKIAGEMDELKKSLSEMRFALILAVVLIYMLLASQFQSFKNPLIVMLSIPVMLIGVSLALLLTGKSVNINSGIGIIMLSGIVVNNAIVLFDYIDMSRSGGRELHDAIIDAGKQRLKPILMTTVTTIFALFPIALGIGEGSELQQPMAIAVIGGLCASTFLTLVFIPTVYYRVNYKNNTGV